VFTDVFTVKRNKAMLVYGLRNEAGNIKQTGAQEPLRDDSRFSSTQRERLRNGKEETMPKEAHSKAAEHHEKAAKSHRSAAEHHSRGDNEQAKMHSKDAHENSKSAHEHSDTAQKKSAAHK
jgi:hypothetical protein